ncbi:HNH endonuclease [Corynebacterium propinquum]|uniref:HNH endonuclease n=1 Tax=Corynebacterium propinquum TaxID=43769 RepID=UPI002070CFAA|nr:MAG TPA: NinG recombination protein [Caudoviricetes sp.]
MTWNNNTKHVPTTTRNTILHRDNHTCQNCGHHNPGGQNLEIDHIDNTRGSHYNHHTNLQTLCTACHKTKTQIEARRARQKKNARKHLPQATHPGLN